MPAKAKAAPSSNGADAAAGPRVVSIPRPNIINVGIRVRGTAPLITNRWSDKAKKEMLDKQMKKAGTGREAKDPERDYEESLYKLPDGKFGFPSVAFKAAAIRAGKQLGLVMADLRTWFHVRGDMVEIEGTPQPREDMVRIQQTTDIRYRGEFPEWEALVPIELDETKMSVEQLVSLFAGAGFGVGVGEWRPEKNGQFGRFEVVEVVSLDNEE